MQPLAPCRAPRAFLVARGAGVPWAPLTTMRGALSPGPLSLPPLQSYDGTMLAFLVADDGIIYMLGGHEAMGKERAFAFLRQVRGHPGRTRTKEGRHRGRGCDVLVYSLVQQ